MVECVIGGARGWSDGQFWINDNEMTSIPLENSFDHLRKNFDFPGL